MRAFRGRRGLVAVVIGGYALVALGLPLPVGIQTGAGSGGPASRLLDAKDRSQPFPCRDKPCGCATAEQCFTSCCCHTPAETLAWAKAHNLEAGVIAALQRRVANDAPTPLVSSCCAAEQEAAATPCCSADSGEASPESTCSDNGPHDEPISCHTVVLQAMLACGGMLGEWLSIADATLPPPTIAVFCLAPLHEPLLLTDEHAFCGGVAPDLPPPRVA